MESEQELDIPAHTLGLHVLYEPEDAEAELDIVAAHGLGGDSFSTWTDRESGCLWLRDSLPKSRGFSKARVMTFGYDARAFIQPFQQDTKGRLTVFAEQLLNDLRDYRPGEASARPIVFVGHSLGGIVIKAVLRHAHERRALYGSIFDSTHTIVFFSTPHQGSDTATWARYLGKLGKVLGVKNTKVTKELQRWSDPLVDLTTAFSEFQEQFQISTYFETRALHGIIVVPEASARMGWKSEQTRALDADHKAICRFAQGDSRFNPVGMRFEWIAAEIKTQQQAKELETMATPAEEQGANDVESRMRALKFG